MTRVLVVGSGGMLGKDLLRILDGFDTQGVNRQQLDIRNFESVAQATVGFDVVINTAAYTRVDDAESDSESAFAVNSVGARNVAKAAANSGAHLIHLSTDYVFDGLATSPYTENFATNPVSVYGRSKRDGEVIVAQENRRSTIVRTSWLYGDHGPSFPRTIARLGHEKEVIDVVNDQVGQPTYTMDVARMIRALITEGLPEGIFHATNSGKASWWDFARSLFARAGWDILRIRPTSSDMMLRPAPRPPWSVLGHDNWTSIGLDLPRHWENALDEAWDSFLKPLYLDSPS